MQPWHGRCRNLWVRSVSLCEAYKSRFWGSWQCYVREQPSPRPNPGNRRLSRGSNGWSSSFPNSWPKTRRSRRLGNATKQPRPGRARKAHCRIRRSEPDGPARAPRFRALDSGTDSTANIGFEISQEIPFPGKRSLRSGMAAKEAESEGQTFRSTELTQVARLKSAFHELRFVYDAIDVLRRNQNLLQRLAKVAEVRYSAGEGNQQDLVRSQLEDQPAGWPGDPARTAPEQPRGGNQPAPEPPGGKTARPPGGG